jgi:hypothetical protein
MREDTTMRTRSDGLGIDIVTHHDDAREPAPSMDRLHWWLIIVVMLFAIFLIGVGVTGGIR